MRENPELPRTSLALPDDAGPPRLPHPRKGLQYLESLSLRCVFLEALEQNSDKRLLKIPIGTCWRTFQAHAPKHPTCRAMPNQRKTRR